MLSLRPEFSRTILVLVALATLSACTGCGDDMGPMGQEIPVSGPDHLSLLVLGDSYTVGEGVPEPDSWPFQLADSLRASGDTVLVEIIARTGWTTTDLLADLAGEAPTAGHDLVTLMIGVNNQFQGRPLEEFTAELAELIDRCILYAGGDRGRVLVFSIPDYGVTPAGQGLGSLTIAEDIDRFNIAGSSVAAGKRVSWLDITPLSRTAAGDTDLVARDDLHFSGTMYTRWVEFMLPVITARLSQNSGLSARQPSSSVR